MKYENDIFEQARKCVNESLIKSYFYCDKSRQNGHEYYILSPLRPDNNVGSFCINLQTGQFIDNAKPDDKGDFIALVSRARGVSLKDAAEMIVKDSGGFVHTEKPEVKQEKQKAPANLNIPESAIESFYEHTAKPFITKDIGEIVKAYKYIKNGELWCIVGRHEKDGNKSVKPYYYDIENKWHAGNPLKSNCPLYNVDEIKADKKILIVEGEKCAGVKLDGYSLLSWIGGGNQIFKSDWSPIANRIDTYFWPDYDCQIDKKTGEPFRDELQPGLKNAIELKIKYPHIKIIDVYKWCRENNKPSGWDIYDAKEENIDIEKFIEERGILQLTAPKTDKNHHTVYSVAEIDDVPFRFLGYGDANNQPLYFLPDASDIVVKHPAGTLSKNKLLQLAPKAFWYREFRKSTTGDAIDWDSAIDWIIQRSNIEGIYSDDNIRGAGIWIDGNDIFVNTGRGIENQEGEKVRPESEYHYVKSSRLTDSFKGEIATKEDGIMLARLFSALGFDNDLESMAAMGWALIAPFCGMLAWRPHIWVNGPRSSGKTYVLENVIEPLVGRFMLKGSGARSSASIWRELRTDSCPIMMDEMEVSQNAMISVKDQNKNLYEIIEIARNASANFSARKSIVGTSGDVEHFTVKSCFCFASVMPVLSSGAIESRFILCNLRPQTSEQMKNKIQRTKEILKSGVMDDPGIFRRKILREIKTIAKNSNKMKDALVEADVDRRDADNYAPLIAAFFTIADPADEMDTKYYVDVVKKYIKSIKIDTDKDEDKLLHSVFDAIVRTDDNLNVSIAELIERCKGDCRESENMTLARNGIRFVERDGKKYLTFANSHTALRNILRETPYAANYQKVLCRHPSSEKIIGTVRFASHTSRATFLKWNEIESLYFTEQNEKTDFSEGVL